MRPGISALSPGTLVRLIGEAGVELSVDGCAVDVAAVGDDDEFGAAGPIGPLVEPVNLSSLPDGLEHVDDGDDAVETDRGPEHF